MTPDAAVSAHLDSVSAPQREVIDAVREVLLAAHPSLVERVKWNSASYHVDGVDLGAFHLRAKGFAQLILVFPDGLVDDRGILGGDWADRRYARFTDLADVEAKSDALTGIVRDWVSLRSS